MRHGIRAHDQQGADDFLAIDFGPKSLEHAGAEGLALEALDPRLVVRRHRVALEDHHLALIARAAIEAIDRNSLRSGLEEQTIVVRLALPGALAHLHFRAVARDGNDLLDREIATGEGDRLCLERRIDRFIRRCRTRGERCPTAARDRKRNREHAGACAQREAVALLDAIIGSTIHTFLLPRVGLHATRCCYCAA